MIEYIMQVEDQNMLQAHYSSGCNRYIYPDDWGSFSANMAKTQREFMNNSFRVTLNDGGLWSRNYYYWLNKDNPNEAVLSACQRNN